jgi:hypothetical protein
MLKKGEALFSLGRWKQAIDAFEAACTYLTVRHKICLIEIHKTDEFLNVAKLSTSTKVTEVAKAYSTVLKEELDSMKECTKLWIRFSHSTVF